MSATIEKEPTHLVCDQRGISLDKRARFRFGKHKGCTVREVWKYDPSYLYWLAHQGWFVEKYQTLVILDEPGSVSPPGYTVAGNVLRPTAWGRA
jgi:hypothetical protein